MTAHAQTAETHALRGWLDSLDYGLDAGWLLTGWAADPNDWGRRLAIQILSEGRRLASATADVYRDDLMRAGIGDGRCGFRVRIPVEAMGGDEPLRFALAAGDGEPVIIEQRTFAFQPLIGRLEGLEGIVAVGWVFDSSDPSALVSVEMLVDGVPVGRIDADQYREDLAERGVGTHGFQWLIPEAYIDDLPHRLTVRVTNRASVMIGEIEDFRRSCKQLSPSVRRAFAMRNAASDRLRSCENVLFSEGRHLYGASLIDDASLLLERLHEEPDAGAVPTGCR